jgi:AcrR family transcriptional regulator
MDRRIQRTRQLLRDSLLTLILERGYDSITIQDITDQANLGRATFYLHFKDKEDLLLTSLEEIYDELVKSAGPPALAGVDSDRPSPVLATFRHAAQHKDLYKVMLNSQGASRVTRRMRDYIVEVVRSMFTRYVAVETLPLPLDILAQHAAGSLLSLLIWWLEHDLPHSPDYMAHVFHTLNVRPLLAATHAAPAIS